MKKVISKIGSCLTNISSGHLGPLELWNWTFKASTQCIISNHWLIWSFNQNVCVWSSGGCWVVKHKTWK